MSKFLFLSALYNFASTSKLITFFRRRYEQLLVQDLNYVLRLKGKYVRATEEIRFLRNCLDQRVTPSDIWRRVRKSKPRNPGDIERAFIRDEIEKNEDVLDEVKRKYRQKLSSASLRLSFVDRIRFCKLVNQTSARLLDRTRTKKEKTLYWLVKTQLGLSQVDHSVITNLSSVDLTDVQKNVLCRGLNYGIPPKVSPELIKAEFELCWQQLQDEPASTDERKEETKSTLSSLARRYANSSVDKSGFPLNREHMLALKDLRANPSIVITKPDKGNGVVILDKDDYVAKMLTILGQEDKFERLGDVEQSDNTSLREKALQAFLLRYRNLGHIPSEVYERIRPVGACRPRMYGLPKLHKLGVPLRPILSMTNAPQHQLAKWLAELSRPVVAKYSLHPVKDTFELCSNLERCESERDIADTYMCSFDIASLFTNIPLAATVQICLDSLYRDPGIVKPALPEKLFESLLMKATTEVEFSFNGVMYRQKDGVAMGSPLGPVLANVFVGYCETLLEEDKLPLFYNRFVDDTFSIFLSEENACVFFGELNKLHPSLCFTMEGEVNKSLPFMDVHVERVGSRLVRSVYRKPMFTGLYTRWDSFSSTDQKVNLIRSLTSRAIKICSQETLNDEVVKLKDLFANNGYPLQLVDRVIRNMLVKQKGSRAADDERHQVFIRLPWIGGKSLEFGKRIRETVRIGYPFTSVRVVFTTTRAFSGKAKDVLPPMLKSCLVYEYKCCCGQTYLGKTTQRLAERVKQHILDKLFRATRTSLCKVPGDSAVTKHLKEYPDCLAVERRENFTILAQARHKAHLDVLEALYIKKLSPGLCLQKEFIHVLALF